MKRTRTADATIAGSGRPRRLALFVVLLATAVSAGLAGQAQAAASPRGEPMAASALAAAQSVAPPAAGTALLRTADGGNWVFAIAANGHIVNSSHRPGAPWSAPRDMGGPFRSGPAATYDPVHQRIDLFAIDGEGYLRTAIFSAGRWSGWARIASQFVGGVSAVRRPDGVLQVYVVSAGGVLYELRRSNAQWSAPVSMGGGFKAASAAVYYPSVGATRILAVGTDGRIKTRLHLGSWRSWVSATTGGGFVGVSGFSVGTSTRVYATHSDRRLFEVVQTSDGLWTPPTVVGGSVIGTPAAVIGSDGVRITANGSNGRLQEIRRVGAWTGWRQVIATALPAVVVTRSDLAKKLLSRWGGRLTGLPGVLADLRTTAAGGAIRNSDSCWRTVYLDEAMLRAIVAATDRYQVLVNNMVTGHGCDSGQHPLGRAVDFNTVIDPATGRRTNWHSWTSGDNEALDREFLTYVARSITSKGGAGQSNCPGSAGASLPAGMYAFVDVCNHQHLDSRR